MLHGNTQIYLVFQGNGNVDAGLKTAASRYDCATGSRVVMLPDWLETPHNLHDEWIVLACCTGMSI